MWRSVLTQQLQADMLACEMASQLLNIAPDPEAKLYYSTMVQDESRHTEAWLKLIEEAGGTAERDPYLDELAHMTLEADTLEEKVFQMQVFYERLIISRFRLIARASRGTVLEDLCNRLTTDDGIHHGAGMAYEKVLLKHADKKTKTQRSSTRRTGCCRSSSQHALWRPKERAFIGEAMRSRDIEQAEGGHRDRRPPGAVARPRRQRRRAADLLGHDGDADGRAARSPSGSAPEVAEDVQRARRDRARDGAGRRRPGLDRLHPPQARGGRRGGDRARPTCKLPEDIYAGGARRRGRRC